MSTGPRLIWLVPALLLGLSVTGQAAAVAPEASEMQSPVSERWQRLDDAQANLSIEEAAAAYLAGEFAAHRGPINRGYTEAASWLAFELGPVPESTPPLYLVIEPVYLDQVDLFIAPAAAVAAGDYRFRQYRYGDARTLSERPLPQAKIVHPLRHDRQETRLVLIRVETRSTHLMDVRVESEAELHGALQWHLLLHGGFVAIALAFALVNALLAVRLRDKALGIYSGYVLSLGIGYAAIEGITNLLFPGIVHQINDWLVSAGTGVGFSLIAWLIMALFNTASDHRIAHYYLRLLALAGLVSAATTGSRYYSTATEALFFIGLPLVVVAMYLAWRSYRAGEPAGKIFLLAFGISTVGATASFLRILGLVPSNAFTLHAVQISSFVHIILMSLGLAERVLETEERARIALRSAEEKAVQLAGKMTQRLEATNETLTQTLSRERALRQDQQHFIETISHDYRTPLSVLKTNLDILRAEGGVASGRLNVMGQAIRSLARIFDEALRSRKFGWVPEDRGRARDLRELVDSMVQDFRSLHPECPLDLELPAEPAISNCNERLMRIVLDNVLDNARKYRSVDVPCISVCISPGADYHRIVVRNAVERDLELPSEALLSAHVRGSTDDPQPGSGVGLFLVRSAVEQMEGRVWLVQDDPGIFEIVIELPNFQPLQEAPNHE